MNTLGICLEGLRITMKGISQIHSYNIQFVYAVLQ
jgi:hypothetical protein